VFGSFRKSFIYIENCHCYQVSKVDTVTVSFIRLHVLNDVYYEAHYLIFNIIYRTCTPPRT
jgi:hypothetical protein